MKKNILLLLPWIFFPFGHRAIAQDDMKMKDKKDKKETGEIIIRKNGKKDATITVQINGDNVLINGKPLVEFKDDGITINKRKMTIRDGGDHMMFDSDDFGDGSFSWSDDGDENRTFLGVSTEKVEDGAKITEITKESGAEKAGLKKDDIITMLNDKKIDGPQSLYDAVTVMKPKDEVRVTYKRDGKESSVKATLQERKNSSHARSFSYSSPDGSYKTFSMPAIPRVRSWNNNDNMLVTPEIPEGINDYNYSYSFPRRQKLGIKIQDTEDENGVKIIEVDDSSAASKAGLKKDDIITEIGGVKVINTDEARDQLQENTEKSAYTIKAKRNGAEMSFYIKIPKKLKTANL